MKQFLLILLLIPTLASAQEGGELLIGETTVAYDRILETEHNTLYFAGDDMVASQSDNVTIVYNQYGTIMTEAHDTDGDGTLDAFVALDKFEQIDMVTGPGAAAFERPTTTSFADLRAGADTETGEVSGTEDLVGSLDRITIPGSGFPWWIIILLLFAIAGAGYWKLYLSR